MNTKSLASNVIALFAIATIAIVPAKADGKKERKRGRGHYHGCHSGHGNQNGVTTVIKDLVLPFTADSASVTGVNSWGTVCGYYQSGTETHGFFGANGNYQALDMPSTPDRVIIGTILWGISTDGAIAGWATDSNFATHPFLYENGVFNEIAYPGALSSQVEDISASGVVLLNTVVDFPLSYLYSEGTTAAIQPPPSTPENDFYSAIRINDNGLQLGSFLFTPDSFGIRKGKRFTPLPTPPAGSLNFASLLNDGSIVGYIDGSPTDLPTYGYRLKDGDYKMLPAPLDDTGDPLPFFVLDSSIGCRQHIFYVGGYWNEEAQAWLNYVAGPSNANF